MRLIEDEVPASVARREGRLQMPRSAAVRSSPQVEAVALIKRAIDLNAAREDCERLQGIVGQFDNNDDELLKGIASRTYADGQYPFDVI